jgi:hypothetical protein
MIGRLVLSVVALWALAGGPAAANVFSPDGADPRRAFSDGAGDAALSPVGAVKTLGQVPFRDGRMAFTTGAGFAVSPCLFLSNFHAVFGATPAVAFPPAKVLVKLWTAAGAPLSSQAMPIAWGGLESAGRDDWALLKLDDCLAGRPDVGWFELGRLDGADLQGEILDTAGYADDLKARFLQRGCRIRAVNTEDKALNDCANRGGSSGSPIFRVADGVGVVLAIQRGELNRADPVLPAYTENTANTAVLAERILAREDVRQAIADDVAAYGAENPLRRARAITPVASAPAASGGF